MCDKYSIVQLICHSSILYFLSILLLLRAIDYLPQIVSAVRINVAPIIFALHQFYRDQYYDHVILKLDHCTIVTVLQYVSKTIKLL